MSAETQQELKGSEAPAKQAWEMERDEIFRSLDAAGVASWIVNLKTGQAKTCASLRFIFGLPEDTPEWSPTERYVGAIHPDDRQAVYDALAKSAENGDGFTMEFRITGSDGKERRILSRGTTVLDANGVPDRLIGAVIDLTERRRAEEALRQSEERRLLALESGGIGAWNIDIATFEMTTDARFKAIFGFSGDEVDYETAFNRIHPDDQDLIRSNVAAACDLSDPKPFGMEYRLIHPDGSIHWVSSKGRLNSSSGLPPTLDGTVVEITEAKSTESAVRQSEAHQRAVLDSAAGGFYSVDSTGLTTLCNAAFLRMLGFQREEDAIGRKLHDVIHHSYPDGSHYPVEECPIYRAASTGVAVHIVDELFFRLDGTSFPVEYWSTPIVVDGEVRGAVTTFIDITERRKAEEALRISEARFRAIQETTPDPFTIVEAVRDEGGKIVDFRRTYVNDATTGLTGEPVKELMGSLVSKQRTDIRETDLYQEWIRTVETGAPFSREVSMTFPSGHKHMRLTGVRMGDGVATSFTDLTERQRNEERLEEAVEARTAELQRAVIEAEGFNYSISHDLRAPLRAISSTSGILLEEAGPLLEKEHRSLLERQAYNANRLGNLIDELLRLSRLSRAPVNRQPLDITTKARTLIDDLQSNSKTNGCRIEVQEGMTATGDPGLVRTILHNLIGNAVKFSPNGGTVRVSQANDVISVSDEGIGFDMKFAPKVFLPFERLVVETEFEGSGIGLANVKRIVERHGGNVWVESVPGEGTTFFFTLSPS